MPVGVAKKSDLRPSGSGASATGDPVHVHSPVPQRLGAVTGRGPHGREPSPWQRTGALRRRERDP